ncbi:MAG: hypothetical protein Alis3KO_05510 [Aliiglaciecola sp.]
MHHGIRIVLNTQNLSSENVTSSSPVEVSQLGGKSVIELPLIEPDETDYIYVCRRLLSGKIAVSAHGLLAVNAYDYQVPYRWQPILHEAVMWFAFLWALLFILITVRSIHPNH